MKKLILFFILIISLNVEAQTYFGTVATGKGIEVSAGTIAHKIDFGIQYRFSPTKSYGCVSATIGKQITFYDGENDDDNEDFNLSLIPSVGVAQHFATVLSQYKEGPSKINYTTAIYKIEAQLSSKVGHRLKYVIGYNYLDGNKFLLFGFKGYLKK